MSNTKTENMRRTIHKINSIFVNLWSGRSMTGEEIGDEVLNNLFELQDGRLFPSTINHGDSYIPKEHLRRP